MLCCNNYAAASRVGKHTETSEGLERGSEVPRGNQAGKSAGELRGHLTADTVGQERRPTSNT